MHLAYDELSDATKQRIDRLKAVHVYLSKYSPRPLRPLSEEEPQGVAAAGDSSAGPHPSRKRSQGALLEPGADRGIIGMEDADALDLVTS